MNEEAELYKGLIKQARIIICDYCGKEIIENATPTDFGISNMLLCLKLAQRFGTKVDCPNLHDYCAKELLLKVHPSNKIK